MIDINRNKKQIKEGISSTYEDFLERCNKRLFVSRKLISKMQEYFKELDEIEYLKAFKKINVATKSYDKSIRNFVFRNVTSNELPSIQIIANTAISNMNTTGTEMEMILNAIEDAAQSLGIFIISEAIKKESYNSQDIRNKAKEYELKIKSANRQGSKELANKYKEEFKNWCKLNKIDWRTNPYTAEIIEESVNTLAKYSPQLKAISKSIHSIIQASAGNKLNNSSKDAIDELYAAYHNLKQSLLNQSETLGESTSFKKAQGKRSIVDSVELNEIAPTENMTVEQLAKLHLENQKKIDDLDAQIQKLVEQKRNAEQDIAKTDENLLQLFGATKTKSEKFGNIIVEFKITRDTYTTRDSYAYKKILDKILETYDIEKKFIDKLYKEFNNGGKTKTDINKELTIKQESKQLKESFLSNLWNKMISTFREYFKSYSNSINNLEKELSNI